MNGMKLLAIIRNTLGTNHVTSGQLLGLLNTSTEVRALRLSKSRLHSILRGMVLRGEVEKTYPTSADPHIRFRLPNVRYRCDNVLDAWQVWRKHPDIADHETRIASNMTEDEARICVEALNRTVT